MKPFLKWAGSKQRVAPKLNAIYDNHRDRRLVEPFCGGLGVALGLMPDRALLNDVSTHLINLYEYIKCNLQIESIDFQARNTEEIYYQHRDILNNVSSDSATAAIEFYYLNLAGFNGLCRYNRSGKFNVPYGKRKKLAICNDFEPYRKAFESWDFVNHDYKTLLINPDDFIVVDPPYDCQFTSYTSAVFDWQQQIELADWLDRCPKVPQIACNAATDRIIQLYTDRGWNIEICDMHTSISCNGDRTPRKEMFATRCL